AEELTRANAELRTAYKDLEVFTYAVAHEFRAPLRAMSGFSALLREEYADKPFDATGQDYARRIEGGARRMDVLIRDLLTYCTVSRSRVETGPVALSAVVQEALGNLSAEIDRGIADVTVEDDFPSVTANRSLLSLALTTLLSNALKFITTDSRPKVRIGHDTRDRRVRVWVEDNGAGIPAEHQTRIFGVFERLQNSELLPGTGIGLAIAKAAAERMGARIGVDSEPGRGSRFWLEFSPAPGALEAAPASAPDTSAIHPLVERSAP
ncbi:MAG: hypothetical protein JO332_12185, partial [Planctomycetaceae bacterium]|nr:hypothetical protein [Planctomycetaceae bacterium]